MFDGFWSGLFGGLFGPAIAQWLSKFKYWVIFVVAMFGTHLALFIAGVYARGWKFAVQVTLNETFTVPGLLVPAGIGVLMVLVAFVGNINSPNVNKK